MGSFAEQIRRGGYFYMDLRGDEVITPEMALDFDSVEASTPHLINDY
jgi:hypothetical protein